MKITGTMKIQKHEDTSTIQFNRIKLDILCRNVSNHPYGHITESTGLVDRRRSGHVTGTDHSRWHRSLSRRCLRHCCGAIYIGLVSTWTSALTLFFISSLGLVIILRSFFSRFIEGDSSVANTEELLDDLDEFVEVIKTIGPADKAGMVKFKGTQWKALGDGQEIAIGSTARIVSRENITLLVKPVDSIEKALTESDT